MRDARIIEGGEEARVKLTQVLRKLIDGPDTDGELEITLVQVAKMGELPVHSWTYSFDCSVEELIKEIVEEAESDAEQIARGKVKYAVRVKGRQLRTNFTLVIPQIDEDDEDYEDLDELPNRKGLIQQQMRHTEVFAKEMISSSKTDRTFMYNMIRDLQAENQQLKRQWFEGQAIIEQLRNMQFARDLEIEKLRKTEQRKDQVAGMLLQAGPMIASKLLGGGAGAAAQTPTEQLGARTPVESMLEGLFTSLEQNPHKLQRIAEVLDPMEMATLAELHKYMADRREKEQEMRQAQADAQKPPIPANIAPYTYSPPASVNGNGGAPYTYSSPSSGNGSSGAAIKFPPYSISTPQQGQP